MATAMPTPVSNKPRIRKWNWNGLEVWGYWSRPSAARPSLIAQDFRTLVRIVRKRLNKFSKP